MEKVYKVSGNKPVQHLKCIDERNDIWVVTFCVETDPENENNYFALGKKYDHKPNLEEVKRVVLEELNNKCDQEILSGHSYEDAMVWLSSENQFNYKAAFDLAMMSSGETLPVTFKFGPTENPCYKTFDNLKDLQNFYMETMQFVNGTLQKYWQIKDNIDWSLYQ